MCVATNYLNQNCADFFALAEKNNWKASLQIKYGRAYLILCNELEHHWSA